MIDKNDVKMPIAKKGADLIDNQVEKIEELLRLVNDAENKQELRLKADYYSRFNWFKSRTVSRDAKSYFSYQEEAVYDFVFNLNKSGILSDQVGMGKTIEAGMIISELASRNELTSLLIIVPNEILAQKWEDELENKFGIKGGTIENEKTGVVKVCPPVKSLKNMDDFSRCVFDCVCKEKFGEFLDYDFKHTYKADPNKPLEIDQIIRLFVKEDIERAVELINIGFENWEMPGNPQVHFDGNAFSITGTDFKKEYKYDSEGKIAHFLRGRMNARRNLEVLINTNSFMKNYTEIIKQELNSMFVVIGRYFATLPNELSAVSHTMIKNNPILVIPIAYSEHHGDNVILREFLNFVLFKEMKNYKHKYNVQDDQNNIKAVYEDYKIVDFFIDVGYQTMIVDEVHDYIDVASRMPRDTFHKINGYKQFPSSEYNRYELFDDYYFIKKSSLYKKLKSLADKASRKIFLTATPIKSDMVDFYLLTLLASNKDADAYKKISESLRVGEGNFAKNDDVEAAVDRIYQLFTLCCDSTSPEDFCKDSSRYLKEEERQNEADANSANRVIRCVYPYFNNEYLRQYDTSPDAVREYLNSHIAYMSVEEIVMELIVAYNAETKSNDSVTATLNKLEKLLSDAPRELQTRVVFRAILNNTIKLRFEEDFKKLDEKGQLVPIKRISELLKTEDGPKTWHRTYRKYGIRHTRHQTYNLTECEDLDKLNKAKVERFKNLPTWPRRDGKVIYLVRDDVFFDSYVDVHRNLSDKKPVEIEMKNIPNIEKMTGDDEVKAERFENAVKIFDYINNSMSGGDPVSHLPQLNKYESVDIDDSGMVDYKLALVNRLMTGADSNLGNIKNKVLLFAENDREAIIEWFRYQKCKPLYTDDESLDANKIKSYETKWRSYNVQPIGDAWTVSDNTDALENADGNALIIIDPKRYEKGVDLQKADTIINFDINYDPLKMEQRIGRIDRIRPKGHSQEINIVSFVPLNNMSGFVINFFAYELKMFTQWMGETTGIVSVPDEANEASKGQQVSFEGKVYNLEKYYNYLYQLCSKNVASGDIEAMAKDYSSYFALGQDKTKYDFEFLQKLREPFDIAFRNSVSPKRSGYTMGGSNDKRVMRFNTTKNPFDNCDSENCDNCPNNKYCQRETENNKKRNNSVSFVNAVKDVFTRGERFYKNAYGEYYDKSSQGIISGNDSEKVLQWLKERSAAFATAKDKVLKALSSVPGTDKSFTIPYEKYDEIFAPIKKLYWDDVAAKYIAPILTQFHKQCDSVLDSAALFEKFIKTLSIADFMNNMEGNV